MEKYIKVFDELADENSEDEEEKERVKNIITVCEAASRIIRDKFRIRLDDPKLTGAIFIKIYQAIINELIEKEATHNSYELDICGTLEIGFTTSSDEDDEKEGNYAIYIHSKEIKKKNDDIADSSATQLERCQIWNDQNNITNPDNIREIAMKAVKLLADIDVNLGSYEYIMPIFITIYETLVKVVSTKRRELDEYSYGFDFLGCFEIEATEGENDIDNIIITPSIDSKLSLKNDEKATGAYE